MKKWFSASHRAKVFAIYSLHITLACFWWGIFFVTFAIINFDAKMLIEVFSHGLFTFFYLALNMIVSIIALFFLFSKLRLKRKILISISLIMSLLDIFLILDKWLGLNLVDLLIRFSILFYMFKWKAICDPPSPVQTEQDDTPCQNHELGDGRPVVLGKMPVGWSPETLPKNGNRKQ